MVCALNDPPGDGNTRSCTIYKRVPGGPDPEFDETNPIGNLVSTCDIVGSSDETCEWNGTISVNKFDQLAIYVGSVGSGVDNGPIYVTILFGST